MHVAVRVLWVALLVFQGACAGRAPTHPALRAARLPDLIPLQRFFAAPRTTWGYQVSPDGKRLAWLAVPVAVPALHWKTIGEEKVHVVASGRTHYGFVWAPDSRHVILPHDGDGSENTHQWVVDLDDPETPPRDLTPYPGVRAVWQFVPRSDPTGGRLLHNRRDPTVFDLFRVDLVTGEETLLEENNGDVLTWVLDENGVPIARNRRTQPGHGWAIDVLEEDGEWRERFGGGAYERFVVVGRPLSVRDVYAVSDRGRDRTALVRVDLETGVEQVLFEHPIGDVEGAGVTPTGYQLLSAWAAPDYVKIHWFDSELGADLDLVPTKDHGTPAILSVDDTLRKMTVAVYGDRTGTQFYLLDRLERQITKLDELPIAKDRERLAEMKPIVFAARDGEKIHGYLTLPKGAGQRLPLVLFVHGGPWSRTHWGFRVTQQFLANRGYAVLDLNYRGSTGYGRRFMEASRGEFAGRMHDDLVDGVRWAVENQFADPEKVAIMGASYGGYATLVGLSFTPEVFAAGIDIVGVSDLATIIERAPPYWKHGLHMWHDFVGDPTDPVQRKAMDARSPLHRLEKIQSPLLVVQGANDVRVMRDQSDRVVEGLRERGHPVEYIVFQHEGHSFRRWQSQVIMHRAIEEFLADHLGGRTGPRELIESLSRRL